MSTMSMQPHLTFDDFLAMERKSELKHELIGGLVYNMADTVVSGPPTTAA